MGIKRASKGAISDNPKVASSKASILAIMFINIMNINNLMEQVVGAVINRGIERRRQ